jgi:hypothetical protein
VGWIEDEPVEFDCTAGCELNAADYRRLAQRRSPALNWLTRR